MKKIVVIYKVNIETIKIEVVKVKVEAIKIKKTIITKDNKKIKSKIKI